MIDLEIVQFKAEHAQKVMASDSIKNDGYDWDEQAVILEESGEAMTLVSSDKDPVLCMGVVPLWEGCGEAWMLAADKISERPIATARAIKEVFLEYNQHKEFRRVQSNVKADWPLAIKFVKFIGMKEEGLMQKFGPEGADYIRFAWIKCQ